MKSIALALAIACTPLAVGNAAAAQTENSPGAAPDQIEELIGEGKLSRALDLAQTLAADGDARGDEWLGWFYEGGHGVEIDVPRAVSHFRIAAAQGRNRARWRLGVLIDEGAARGSPEEAVGLFEDCAAEDWVNCIVSLAVMQATGRGTPRDFPAALASYMRAAQLGDANGMRGVAVMMARGEGVKANLDEAYAWLLLSASLGNEQSQASIEAIRSKGKSARDFAAIARRALDIAEELGVEAPIVIVEETAEPEPSA